MEISLEYVDSIGLDSLKAKVSKSHFLGKELSEKSYDDAIVLPFKTLNVNELKFGGGVIASDGSHVSVMDIGDYRYEIQQVETVHKKAIHLGYFHPKWGHAITDNIKKLWYLDGELPEDVMLIYVPCDGFSMTTNFQQLLECLDVNPEKLVAIVKPTKFDKLIIPDDSFIWDGGKENFTTRDSEGNHYFTKEYKEMIDRICSKTVNICDDCMRIYLSRSHWDGADFGEKDIEIFFKRLGYRIVYPETMDFYQQLSLFQSCRCLVSTEGSIGHNSLFLKEGSELILIRKFDGIINYQFPINEMKKLKVTYVDSHLSLFSQKWDGPFFLYVNDNLQRFAAEQTGKKRYLNSFKSSAFLSYVKQAFCLGLAEKHITNPFYFERCKTEMLNENRHKLRKPLSRLLPKRFPWNV